MDKFYALFLLFFVFIMVLIFGEDFPKTNQTFTENDPKLFKPDSSTGLNFSLPEPLFDNSLS